jgi:hypothetical protein
MQTNVVAQYGDARKFNRGFLVMLGLTILVMQINLVGFGEVIETAHCSLVRLMD